MLIDIFTQSYTIKLAFTGDALVLLDLLQELIMKELLNLHHRVCESTCYVNGLEDIFEWKGQNYPDYLLSILGGMGEFTYLKFKSAHPPYSAIHFLSPM